MTDFLFNENFSNLPYMKVKKFKKGKVPVVVIDPSLDEIKKNMPPSAKLIELNEKLKTMQLPERTWHI